MQQIHAWPIHLHIYNYTSKIPYWHADWVTTPEADGDCILESYNSTLLQGVQILYDK